MSTHSDEFSIPLQMSDEIIEHGTQRTCALTSAMLFTHSRGIKCARTSMNVCQGHKVHAAFIVIVDGTLVVGANIDQLQYIAQCQVSSSDRIFASPQPGKTISLRDIPLALQFGWSGGLSTAATAAMAHLAGISFFATDVITHSDLHELSRHLLLVVGSAVGDGTERRRAASTRSFTEALQHYQLPLIGYRRQSLPLLSDRNDRHTVAVSGCVEQPAEIAALFQTTRLLNRQRALLVAHPFWSPILYTRREWYVRRRLDMLVQNAQLAAEIVAELA